MPQMLCPFAANWWFYIYCACASTSIGTFSTPEKCKRYSGASLIAVTSSLRTEKQRVMFLYRSVQSVHFLRVLIGFLYSSIRRRSRLPGRTVKCLNNIRIRKGDVTAGPQNVVQISLWIAPSDPQSLDVQLHIGGQLNVDHPEDLNIELDV